MSIILMAMAAATTNPERAYIEAIEHCDQSAFVALLNEADRQLLNENKSLRLEIQSITAEELALIDRKQEARRKNPLAVVFKSRYNRVEISEAEADLQDRKLALDSRITLYKLQGGLIRDRRAQFATKCGL